MGALLSEEPAARRGPARAVVERAAPRRARRGDEDPRERGEGRALDQNDARHALARAAALYLGGAPQRAIASLGPKPDGAAASYLLGLCHASTGSLLRAAAAFQEVADRWPSSPLADAARLAKANAFLMARDDRSAALGVRPRRRPYARSGAPGRGGAAHGGRGVPVRTQRLGAHAVARHCRAPGGHRRRARAQFLIGEVLVAKGNPADAILEFNRVLARYFQHAVAASAQYRVARCLDQLGRKTDATGSYEAVVRGYPLEPEAPAAGYLAGVGLLAAGPSARRGALLPARDRPLRVARRRARLRRVRLARAPGAGRGGALSARALVPSRRRPRPALGRAAPAAPAHAAEPLAVARLRDAVRRRRRRLAGHAFPRREATLDTLLRAFSDRPIGARGAEAPGVDVRAQQHRDSLAIATEERLLARHGANGDEDLVAGAMLDIAHERFNQKRYRDAAAAYEDFLTPPSDRSAPNDRALPGGSLLPATRSRRATPSTAGRQSSGTARTRRIAERTWARAGDLYFQAARYADAERCYRGLLDHFAGSTAASLAMLRLAQCEYNAGHDAGGARARSRPPSSATRARRRRARPSAGASSPSTG